MLCFQGEPLADMPGSQIGPVPIISMYGVTMAGNSVAVCVHGFAPYFYVPAIQGFRPADCAAFRVSEKKVLFSSHVTGTDFTFLSRILLFSLIDAL
jgi:hypothetical protein